MCNVQVATFHRYGTVKCHHYSQSQPLLFWQKPTFIQIYVATETVTEWNIPTVPPKQFSRNVSLNIINIIWLQLDGTFIHFSAIVKQWFHEEFGETWIGRGGPVRWPVRSPDIKPCDLILRGYVKDKVYAEPLTTK